MSWCSRTFLSRARYRMNHDGLGLSIAEQNPNFAKTVADRVHVIEKGSVEHTGATAEFDASREARDAHLAS